MNDFRLEFIEPLRKFFDAIPGADGAHNQPDGQREGNTQNQKDNGYPVHMFYSLIAAHSDAAQCVTDDRFVASGNADGRHFSTSNFIMRA